MSARHCRFPDLPEDLQVLLFEIIGNSGGDELLTKLEGHRFAIHELPIAAFPDASISGDYRDRAYAEAMAGQPLPPVIICGKNWLDGGHRVWLWRKSGIKRVPCLDLADIGLTHPFAGIAYLNETI
jgi:hypothetical protein